jgi:hypothetical protein
MLSSSSTQPFSYLGHLFFLGLSTWLLILAILSCLNPSSRDTLVQLLCP